MNLHMITISRSLSDKAHAWMYENNFQGIAGQPDHNNLIEEQPGDMEFMAWWARGNNQGVTFYFNSDPDLAMLFKLTWAGV